MALLAIAYPEFDLVDFQKIQSFREQNDPLFYSVVAPHITFVFPVLHISVVTFKEEIKRQLADTQAFDFIFRCATVNKDAFSEMYHCFLVPDEGYSSIIKLHDKLYEGLLRPELRLDIDFIPHLGIGNNADPTACQEMARTWNQNEFTIQGSVNSLSIVSYENGVVKNLDQFRLAGA